MELEKKMEKQHSLLERLFEELEVAGLPCRIDTVDIPGTDKKTEICRLLMDNTEHESDPMMAEFFFMNTEVSAPDLIYFTALMTIREDMRLIESMQLMEFLTALNFSLPFGAFKLNVNSGLLTYRLDAIYNANESDDSIYPHLTATAANMLNACNTFSPVVLEVCDGELTIYEAMKMLKLGSFAEG